MELLYNPVISFLHTELAKKFVWVFPYHFMGKTWMNFLANPMYICKGIETGFQIKTCTKMLQQLYVQ